MLHIAFRSKITKNGGCWTGIIPINVHFEALWLVEIELRLNWIRLKALWRRIPNCLQSSTLLNTGLFVRISSKQWMIRFHFLLLQNKRCCDKAFVQFNDYFKFQGWLWKLLGCFGRCCSDEQILRSVLLVLINRTCICCEFEKHVCKTSFYQHKFISH